MPSELPIACSLSGSDLQARYRDLKRFGSDNLIGHAADDQGHTLRFRRSPELVEGLALLARAGRRTSGREDAPRPTTMSARPKGSISVAGITSTSKRTRH
jgi:hypothetical protein